LKEVSGWSVVSMELELRFGVLKVRAKARVREAYQADFGHYH